LDLNKVANFRKTTELQKLMMIKKTWYGKCLKYIRDRCIVAPIKPSHREGGQAIRSKKPKKEEAV